MPLYDNFPYTNFHALNLDYILETQKKQEEAFEDVIEEATDIKDSTIQYRDEAKQLRDQTEQLKEDTEAIKEETAQLKEDTEDLKEDVDATAENLSNAVGQIEHNTENIALNSARITEIASLTEGSTSGDAELADIRVGYNGVTYSSAGNSVRAQANILQSQITDNKDRSNEIEETLQNYNTNTTVNITDSTADYTADDRYCIMYFDEPVFIHSIKPVTKQGYQWAIGTFTTDISDGVRSDLVLSDWTSVSQNKEAIIDKVIDKKTVIFLRYNIFYTIGRTTSDYKNQGLALYNPSTGAVVYGIFVTNNQVKGYITYGTLGDKVIPYMELLPDMSLFENMGVIGDSFASGTYYPDNVGQSPITLSWPQIIGRHKGIEAHNFTIPGCTSKSWYTDTSEYGRTGLLNADALQLYIISLGINDSNISLDVGQLSDIENVDNPEELTGNTFYINIAKIIHCISTKSPHAKIVLMTNTGVYYNTHDYDEALLDIADYYNLPCIDQRTSPYYKLSAFTDLVNYHPSPVGYSIMAKAIIELFETMMNNSDYSNYLYKEYLV